MVFSGVSATVTQELQAILLLQELHKSFLMVMTSGSKVLFGNDVIHLLHSLLGEG